MRRATGLVLAGVAISLCVVAPSLAQTAEAVLKGTRWGSTALRDPVSLSGDERKAIEKTACTSPTRRFENIEGKLHQIAVAMGVTLRTDMSNSRVIQRGGDKAHRPSPLGGKRHDGEAE